MIESEEGRSVTHRKRSRLNAIEEGGTADQSTRVNILIDSEEEGRTAQRSIRR